MQLGGRFSNVLSDEEIRLIESSALCILDQMGMEIRNRSLLEALNTIPTLLAGGHVWMDAGLLAIDEACSPIQMVLDNEWVGALKHLVRSFAVDEETVGLAAILAAGPGGNFLDSPHTAGHFRREHWEPAVWSRQMLRPWLESDGRLDVDRAREWISEVERKDTGPPAMEESRQREILHVIESARQALGA